MKKSYISKFTSLFLTLVVLTMMFNLTNLTAFAGIETGNDGYFKWKGSSTADGEFTDVIITGYTGNETEITIPTEINYNDKSIPVTALYGYFSGNDKIKSITIPGNIGLIYQLPDQPSTSGYDTHYS